ncbi:MAG TPA: hypothetical protein VGN12_10470 [Pirellulales bacterium]|jgi:hypothetical protein
MNRCYGVIVLVALWGFASIAPATYCAACPQVATAQAAALPVAPSAVVAAPFAQAFVGGAYALPGTASQATVALPVTVTQPLVVAQSASLLPLGAVANAGCAGGTCARASARVGGAGVRRTLLPRQRSVARAVVR